MQDKQASSSEVWKSKDHSDVTMETLPSSHVVNTLLQVSVSGFCIFKIHLAENGGL